MPELKKYGGAASESLLKRFESDHGYVEFPETIETRTFSGLAWSSSGSEGAQSPGSEDIRRVQCGSTNL